MGNKTTDFLLRKEYEEWLTKNGVSKNSVKDYVKQDVEPKTRQLYYDIIPSFLRHHEPIYAYTLLNKWCEDNKNNGKKYSYLKKYRHFIHTLGDVDGIIDVGKVIPEKDLIPIRKSFKKGELAQLDGMDSLVGKLSDEGIIKLAVESSFFFDEEIVKKRFVEITNQVPNGCLPARPSQKDDESQNKKEGSQVEDPKDSGNWFYEDENGNRICEIKKDGNGNAKVCQIINNYTGYHLGNKLEKKPFKNYIISHIWGRAIDPRYFTNLWNVVLVPAWANHLLDKDADEDSLSAILKATFMKICIQYYGLNTSEYGWDTIKMMRPECKGKFKKSEYKIHIIKKVSDFKKQIGIIDVHKITLR